MDMQLLAEFNRTHKLVYSQPMSKGYRIHLLLSGIGSTYLCLGWHNMLHAKEMQQNSYIAVYEGGYIVTYREEGLCCTLLKRPFLHPATPQSRLSEVTCAK